MTRYSIKYYTSGGYKASGVLDTKYVIEKDQNNNYVVINGEEKLGGIDMIEKLLLTQLGYDEEITVISVEPKPPNHQ